MSKITLLGATTLFLVLSCTISRDENKGFSSLLVPKAGDEELLDDYASLYPQNASTPIFHIKTKDCDRIAQGEFTLVSTFSSVVGNHTIVGKRAENQTNLTVKIDNSPAGTVEFNNFDSVKSFCSEERGKVEIPTAENAEKVFKGLLKGVAPHCSFNFNSTSGWACLLDTENQKVTHQEIKSVRKAMIRGSRQPYSLSRKIAVAEQLYKALQSTEDQKLDGLCSVLKLSETSEIPLAIKSERVFKALCESPFQRRRDLAKVSLKLAVQEIKTLKGLYRSHSKIGLIQLKMPSTKVPSKDLWVRVISTDNVEKRAERFNQAVSGLVKSKVSGNSCWHPYFSGVSSFYLNAAGTLKLIQKQVSQQCNQEAYIADLKLAVEHIQQAISSETEFVVSNGNAKLLRLPKGSYKYVIEKHARIPQDNLLSAEDNTAGHFKWARKRPSIVIKTW